MRNTPIAPINITRFSTSQWKETPDLLAVEEPLEIRLGYGPENRREQKPLTVTMRTPGNDEELAIGLLFAEGIIQHYSDVLSIKPCCNKDTGDAEANIIRAELAPSVKVNWDQLGRTFLSTASCGLCGKNAIESLHNQACTIPFSNQKWTPEIIHQLSEKMQDRQAVFARTGGLHAAGLFDSEGNLLRMREDIGRHNALDKLIGSSVIANQIPLTDHLIFLSGRIGFELVQKAVMAGVSVLAAVGAPSSLAVELAREMNLTLLGFVRNQQFNVYAGGQRISMVSSGNSVHI